MSVPNAFPMSITLASEPMGPTIMQTNLKVRFFTINSLKTAESLNLSSQDLINLTEGMSVKSMARKRLNTLLKTMIILDARKG